MVNSTPTPEQSPAASNGALSVDQLFQATFNRPRDPRSTEYKAGVRAALQFRIEGRRIPKLYDPASAQDDAHHAGMAEGHALWRAAVAKTGGAA